MCKSKSFIATQEGLYGYVGADSHSEIKRIAGIKDSHIDLEFVSPDPISAEYENWELRANHDTLPDWFIMGEWKQRCIDWMVEHTVHDIDICADNIEMLTGHCECLLPSGYIGLVLGTINRVDGRVDHLYGRIHELCGTVDIVCSGGIVNTAYGPVDIVCSGGTVNTAYGTVEIVCSGGTVNTAYGTVDIVCSGGTVNTAYGTVYTVYGTIGTAHGRVEAIEQEGTVNLVDFNSVVTHLRGTVSKIGPGGRVGTIEPGGRVNLIESGGTVDILRDTGTVDENYGTIHDVESGSIIEGEEQDFRNNWS